MTLKSAIHLTNVSKTFKGMTEPALNKVTASLEKGIIIGLVGPDGAGKTTLMRLMTGLLLPTTGHITVLGIRTDSPRIHDIAGYMPQKFGLYEDLTVIENLTLYADLAQLEEKAKEETIDRMFTFTALRPFKNRLAGKLSGGMKQKLGLACALLSQPQVLFLDEPSVGVDPVSRRELWKMVQELADKGMTIVWATSYLDEADKCHQVLLLNEGKLLFNGPPQTLTDTLKGRVFRVKTTFEERRKLLRALLNSPLMTDSLIQGNTVRCVLKSPLKEEVKGWEPIAPRFEDAFVDILGGTAKGDSVLVRDFPAKKKIKWPLIKAEHLTKNFGDFTAANDISFSINQGEIFGLLGPNGAGKSTIFRMLCGLLKPTKGEAFVAGFNLQQAPSQARSRIGYMAQKFALYKDLSVEQNLNFFAGVYGLNGPHRTQRIELMIHLFELDPFLKQNAGLLPLGYAQRLALACAIMHEPDVLFLDEPTSGVDPLTRREFWTHINGMVSKGVTVMVTTHFLEEAEYCDRIALIYQGVSIASGTPDDLKKKVTTPTLPNPTLEDAFITLIEQRAFL
jgi:ABC-2 type transport system ATP-binding protein